MKIRSYSYSQQEILSWISTLNKIDRYDLDCTYSSGRMWHGVPGPRIKCDILPQGPGVLTADARSLPFKGNSIKSLVFDPPFIPAGGAGSSMKTRYGSMPGPIDNVWALYRDGLKEFARVLVPMGIAVVKTQDTIYGRTQYLTHVEVINQAVKIHLYPKDIFICLSKTRPEAWNHKRQHHARKYHCYFIVFQKSGRNPKLLS